MSDDNVDHGARGLHVEVWGDGTPVVLVHGALATGAEEWEAQRSLAEQGFCLVVPDRRGNGLSASADHDDFLVDADDIVELLGDGAHLVGHSYGGLGATIAAARRPEATLSLTLLEAPAADLAADDPSWRELCDAVRRLWSSDAADEEWVLDFLEAVGSDPDQLPDELIAAAVELVPVFRRGRSFFDADLPLAELAEATFPKLVVSGGHHAGWDAMSRDLADRIRADHAVVEGAGHEIQFSGQAINELFQRHWSRQPDVV